jgi:hypothetical protein
MHCKQQQQHLPWLVSQLRDLVTAVSNDDQIHYANQ